MTGYVWNNVLVLITRKKCGLISEAEMMKSFILEDLSFSKINKKCGLYIYTALKILYKWHMLDFTNRVDEKPCRYLMRNLLIFRRNA